MGIESFSEFWWRSASSAGLSISREKGHREFYLFRWNSKLSISMDFQNFQKLKMSTKNKIGESKKQRGSKLEDQIEDPICWGRFWVLNWLKWREKRPTDGFTHEETHKCIANPKSIPESCLIWTHICCIVVSVRLRFLSTSISFSSKFSALSSPLLMTPWHSSSHKWLTRMKLWIFINLQHWLEKAK
jgi:hypothetical protein